MKNERYAELREKWRAMIRTRDDRSEIVNYDDPSFPSYSFEGHLDGSSPWIRKAHWHYVLQAAKTHIPEASAVNYEHIDSLKNMIGFIKGNYMDKLSLESIAAVGNMSKSSCNTIFKKYTSHTPNEYLIRYRLDKAMELLRTTDMPIGTISMECGFASASYMTEQFVKCYKTTPRDFRNSKH